jgi:transcriptional regulator with XRE-family HTH domain
MQGTKKAAAGDVGTRLRNLRKRCGVSVRELALRAELSPALISYAERGITSMSLVTLEKALSALGTSFAEFFGEQSASGAGPVYAREQMRTLSDSDRTYTILFNRQAGAGVEMADEHIRPSKTKPPFTVLKSDIAGYVLAGSLVLEVRGEGSKTLRTGDGFYLKKRTAHRGYAAGADEVRLITVSVLTPA